ncbi:MAG: zinc carboxypeptidase, partial [Thermoflexibacter sp.]|nr:zinc carboxypeptidase [Thermoflexibacter sp.]
INELRAYLDKQQIRYGYAKNTPPKLVGYNYFTNKEENITIQRNDIIINTYQPKSVLIKVLFNPKTVLSDSITYDATAWAIPYSYGLKSFALTQKIDIQPIQGIPSQTTQPNVEKPYSYIAEWKSFKDLQFLVKLLNKGIKVRFAEKGFSINNKKYSPGTIAITRTDNEFVKDLDNLVTSLATELQQPLEYANTGFANEGADLGSNNMHFLKKPHIALLTGDGVGTNAFGELWHYFDQQLGYPVTVVNSSYLSNLKMSDFDVMILPDGNYNNTLINQCRSWVQQGGKLIVMEGANYQFADNETFELKRINIEKPKDDKDKKNWDEYLRKYEDRERSALSDYIAGSIFKVTIDNTHPLGFGYGKEYYSLRQITDGFEYFKSGWNVGVIKDGAYIDGFVGYKAKQKLKNSLVFGVSEVGRGTIVHLIDNPIFRSSWANGKLLMGNAVFFVGQ